MRVIAYARVSTEEQAQTNYSLDAQGSRYELLCKQNQWQSLGFYPETGSGTSIAARPIFKDILERISRGGVDALWVKETDRLSRPEDLGDISKIADTLSRSGTKLIVETQEFDLAEDLSVLMFDFHGVLAKHFRRQLLRNMNRGKLQKAREGKKAGGADVYGYRTVGGSYQPYEREAATVRLIFDLALCGKSIRQIQAELHAQEIPSSRGLRWSVSVLGGILKNDLYVGVYRFMKTKQGQDKDGSRYKIHQPEQIIVGTPEHPNHPPLIDNRIFAAVQERLAANRRQSEKRLHLATGILRCPICAHICHVKYSRSGTKSSTPKYVCSNKPHCPGQRLDLQEVNAKLWDELLGLILKPERLDELVRSAPVDANIGRELERLDSQTKAITQKLQRLLTLYEDGDLDKATYLSRRDQHEKHLHQIRVVAERTRGLLQNQDQRDSTTALQHTLRILGRSQSRFTEDQKECVFRSMVKQARLGDDSLTLELYTEPIENIWYKYRQTPNEQRRDLNLKRNRTTRCALILGW